MSFCGQFIDVVNNLIIDHRIAVSYYHVNSSGKDLGINYSVEAIYEDSLGTRRSRPSEVLVECLGSLCEVRRI